MITEKLHNKDLSDMRTDLSEIRKAARESVQSLQLSGSVSTETPRGEPRGVRQPCLLGGYVSAE